MWTCHRFGENMGPSASKVINVHDSGKSLTGTGFFPSPGEKLNQGCHLFQNNICGHIFDVHGYGTADINIGIKI